MNSQKHSGTQEVVDMELHCVTCGTRLYIPMSQAGAVVASLERCGAAILVTRLRIWGRSSESFAREWDRGRRFDWLPELSIPGRGHADFSLEGFVKGYTRFIAEKLCDLFYLDVVLEQAGCSVHAPMSEIRDRGLTHQTGKASGEF